MKKFKIPLISCLITLVFSILTIFYSWKFSSPFCYADDWRFIKIFLIPFQHGDLKFSQLWSDSIHPDPIAAIIFLINAKFFNLQMNYSTYVEVLFQIAIFGIFLNELRKSIPSNNSIKILIPIIIIALIFFSFTQTSKFEWWLVTHGFLQHFLIFIFVVLTNNAVNDKKNSIKLYVLIAIINLINLIINNHFALFGNFAIILVLTIPIIFDKDIRRKFLILTALMTFCITISVIIISFLPVAGTPSKFDFSQSLILLFSNFIKTSKSVGIAYLSGIFNFDFLSSKLGVPLELWDILSIPILLLFLLSLVFFFQQKIYIKSIFPGFLMLYSLLFIFSVLLVRYNPTQERGIFCLSWDRYIVIYQFGLIGFFWNTLLIIHKINFFRKISPKMKYLSLSFLAIFLFLNWGLHYNEALKRGNYLINVYYPETALKMKNEDINIVKQTIWGRNTDEETLEYIRKNKLNIFAPNFPKYSIEKLTD